MLLATIRLNQGPIYSLLITKLLHPTPTTTNPIHPSSQRLNNFTCLTISKLLALRQRNNCQKQILQKHVRLSSQVPWKPRSNLLLLAAFSTSRNFAPTPFRRIARSSLCLARESSGSRGTKSCHDRSFCAIADRAAAEGSVPRT